MRRPSTPTRQRDSPSELSSGPSRRERVCCSTTAHAPALQIVIADAGVQQAAACWAEVHGITMLVIDGLFVPEKVGQNAIEEALTTLFEGLAI